MSFTFFDFPPWKGGKIIAWGERSEPLDWIALESPGRSKEKPIAPSGLILSRLSQGFASLTPGYYLPPLRGLKR
jgi:hypothetical protein